MNVLFSKTDSLGDQLLVTGFCRHVIQSTRCDRFFWMVRSGYESVAGLWEGSVVSSPNRKLPPDQAAREILGQLAIRAVGGPPVFIPVDMDAYHAWPDDRDLTSSIRWWGDFVHHLQPAVAIAGSCTLNWVDWFLTIASGAERRVAVSSGGQSQEIPTAATAYLSANHREQKFTDLVITDRNVHELDRFRKIVSVLGLPDDELHMVLDVSRRKPPSEWSVQDALVISPGAGDPRRCWPVKNFAAVLQRLAGDRQVAARPVVLLCGPADQEPVEQLERLLSPNKLAARVLRSGPADLPWLTGLLSKAALLLANESFVGHLGAAVGTPTVAVWGGGHWGRFVPRQGHVTVVHQPLSCIRCDWNCLFDQYRCISEIEVDTVYRAVCERLDRPQEPVFLVAAPVTVTDEEIRERFQHAHDELRRTLRHNSSLQNWLQLEITAKQSALLKTQAAEEAKAKAERWAQEEQTAKLQARNNAQQERQAKKETLKWAQAVEEAKTNVEQWARAEQIAKHQAQQMIAEEQAAKEKALVWARGAEEAKTKAEQWARAEQTAKRQTQQTTAEQQAAKEKALLWAHAAEEAKAKAERWAQEEQTAKLQARSNAQQERQAKEEALAWAHAAEEAKAKAERWAQEEQTAKLQARSNAQQERQAKEEALAWAHAAEEAKAKAERWAQEEQTAKLQARSNAQQERQAKEEALKWAHAAEEAKVTAEQWAREEQTAKLQAEKQRRQMQEWIEARSTRRGALKHFLEKLFRG